MRIARPLLLLSLLLTAAQAGPEASGALLGDWQNPDRSIVVRIRMCGAELCGTIVSANSVAERDARKAGTERLVGTELLHGYRRSEDGRWTGMVYVPDKRKSFPSKITQMSPTMLRISICAMGGLICQSQDWTRL